MKHLLILMMLFASLQAYSQEFGAKIKMKPQADRSYRASEDAEIRALAARHGLGIRRSLPASTDSVVTNPELFLYYTITIEERRYRTDYRENYINDFLATGKFEDEVHLYKPVHPA